MNGEVNNISLLGSNTTKYIYDNPSAGMLEWFQSPSKEPYAIFLTCPEFTSLCPKTGQPDFAEILIEYIPNERCVESKSLKLYLFSYRNFGEFHEACVNRIVDDLCAVIAPRYIRVEGKFRPRGGIAIIPVVERGRK